MPDKKLEIYKSLQGNNIAEKLLINMITEWKENEGLGTERKQR